MNTLVDAFEGRKTAPEFKLFDVQIECRVCTHLTFDTGLPLCWQCHWPLSVEGDAEAFGHEAAVRLRGKDGVSEMKRIGPLRKLRAAVKSKHGEILSVRSLTRAQWSGAYGLPESRRL